MFKFTLKIARDKNGNRIAKVKPNNGRAFSIQTNGNLPKCHGLTPSSNDNDILIAYFEVKNYIKRFGTDKQKAVICD